MKPFIFNALVILFSLFSAIIELKVKNNILWSSITFYETWITPFIFLLTIIGNRTFIKEEFSLKALFQFNRLLVPFIFIFFSLFTFVIEVRNNLYYLDNWESDFLAFNSRYQLILSCLVFLHFFIHGFNLSDKVKVQFQKLFGEYKLPIWITLIPSKLLLPFKHIKESLIVILTLGSLFGLSYLLVQYKPTIRLQDSVQSSDSQITTGVDENGNVVIKKKALKTISAYFTAPYDPNFTYVDNKIEYKISPLVIRFSENPFKLEDSAKLKDIFTIIPPIKGKWSIEDKQVSFVPENFWPVNESIMIKIDQSKLRKDIKLNRTQEEIKTREIKVSNIQGRFYVNPKDSNQKKAVIQLDFNYPIDKDSLKEQISFVLKNNKNEYIREIGNTIFHNDLKNTYYIHSDSINLKSNSQTIVFKMEKGVRSIYDLKPIESKEKFSVSIPSKYSFLNIKVSQIEVGSDDKDKPYHRIKINSNTRIDKDEIREKFFIQKVNMEFTKDEYKEVIGYYSKDYDHCFSEIYGKNKLELSDSCAREFFKLKRKVHPLIIDGDPLSFELKEEKIVDLTKFELLINPEVKSKYVFGLKQGLEAKDGYELEYPLLMIDEAQEFPKILRFAQSGSILSFKGDKTISLYSRGLSQARVVLKQVKANQLHHLLTQSNASKINPYFNGYNFNQDNITDLLNETVYFPDNYTAGKYSELNFSKLLSKTSFGQKNHGIFFVSLRDSSNKEYDSKILILSDMAYLIKKAPQRNFGLYVMSQTYQEPLSDVNVIQVNKNGTTKTVCKTNSQGYCEIPKKEGVGFYLKNGQDLLYIKDFYDDDRIDYSRFEIAGEYGISNELKSSLFTDRKLYRPGEEGHIGLIFKDGKWTTKYIGELINIEIMDSRGKVILTEDQKIQKYGYNTLDFALSYAAPTGSYTITTSLYEERQTLKKNYTYKRRIGSHTFKVQEFLPDKLKVSARFNKGNNKLWVNPDELKANVSVRNLFGTPAAGNKIETSLILKPFYINIPKFKSYRFFDNNIIKKSFTEFLDIKNTDENGKVEYNLDLEKYKGNTFHMTLHSEAFLKSGGRSVVAENEIIVSDHKFLVGYKALGNLNFVSMKTDIAVELVAINNAQDKVAENVQVSIFEKKYQNSLVEQADKTFAYQDIKEPILVKKEEIEIPEAGLKYILKNKKVGEYIVKIHNNKNELINSFEYNVVGEADIARSLHRSNELKVTLDKKDYKNGESIKVSIKAPYKGAGLITIEQDNVYAYRWFEMNSETDVFDIKVPKEIEGNGYINVVMLRSVNSKKIFTSPLSYAAVPFTLDKSKLVQDIELKAENLVKPGEEVIVKYRTKEKGSIIIYAVDKGIHQLANYVTPRPIDDFYKKQALRVETYQIFSLILPDIDSVRKALAPGGSSGVMKGRNLNPFKRKFKKAVAFWSGQLPASSDWRNYRFEVPSHFNGELVLHAIFVNNESIGVQKGAIVSRDDVIITPTIPTFSSPGDKFQLASTITNNIDDKETSHFTVELKTSQGLKFISKKEQKIQIPKAQDEVVIFELEATENLGNTNIEILVKHTKGVTRYSETLSVRPLNPAINRNWEYLMTEGDYRVDLDDVEFYPEFLDIELSFTNGLFALIAGSLKYLTKYPYGCSEQITSKAIPYAVFSSELLNKTELEIDDFLKKTNNTLLQRQNEDGGIALYAGRPTGSDFLNLYIAHFLTITDQKGKYVNKRLFQKILEYITKLSQSTNRRTQSHALYLMALNEIQIGAQVKNLSSEKYNDPYVDLYLAGTYKILKNDKKALYHIKKALKYKNYQYKNQYGYYASSFDRMSLGVLLTYFPDYSDEYVMDLVKNIVSSIKRYGASSLWSGQVLLSLSNTKKNANFSQLLNIDFGEKKKKINVDDFNKLGIKEKKKIKSIELDIDKSGFYLFSLNANGFPKNQKAFANELQISKEVLDGEGNKVSEIKNGEELYIKLTVQASKYIRNAVIVDLLPGGFDLVWKKSEDEKLESTLDVEFVDQREDRMVIYTSLNTEVKTFYYKIKAISNGTFKIPPAYGENMYKTKEAVLTNNAQITVK